MNDFLDRVTAKAIGNEAMLTPRLPSLFEPQAASIMPTTFETNTVEGQRNARVTPDVSDAVHADRALQRSPSALEPRLNEAARKQTPSQTDATPILTPRVATQPAIETTLRSTDVSVEKTVQPRRTDGTPRQATTREPVEPRASRVSSESPSPPALARMPETGVLLPPTKPVFVATKNLGDLPARAAEALHARSIAGATHRAGQSEPVVHVSIGRLEVRATPNSATTTTRRNDAPRPSSLDDYLRQRGKAVP